MESFLNFFLLNLILVSQIHGQKACLEEERIGLLELMSFAKLQGYVSKDVDHVFRSWVSDVESNCCGWERVTCNSTTGRVVQLSLYNLMQQDPPPCTSHNVMTSPTGSLGNPKPRLWKITLFEPFKEIRLVNLSNNQIDGWSQNQGLLSLEGLVTLDLTCNKFRRDALLSLKSLASIKNLILRSNLLEGSFPADELSVFGNLETLDLSLNKLSDSPTKFDMGSFSKLRHLKLHSNNFTNDILEFVDSLSSLRSLDLSSNHLGGSLSNQDLKTFERLKILDLSHNNLSGSIPQNIGKLSALKVLYLSSNLLSGSLPNPGLCELQGLQKLDIGHNSLEGILPQCLNNLTSLEILDLHLNQFNGSISSYLTSSPKSLQFIDFSDNYFEGSFSFSSIFNHSKLEIIILSGRENKLQIDTELVSAWNIPQFQLRALELSGFNLKNSTLSFLHSQHRLEVVDLSHNMLNESFPSWLLENNTNLKFLKLRNNSFTGRFRIPQQPLSGMIHIDLSSNHLVGQLPEDLGIILPNIKVLNLSLNHFEGELPTSISGMTKLEKLALCSNNFTGEVPKDLVQNCTNLIKLMLSNNNFHGEFFPPLLNLTKLKILGLGNNQFSGGLPNTEYYGGNLFLVDVSNNNMRGEIPSWIYNVSALAIGSNHFEGRFSCNQPFNGSFIDLSHNSLSGPLPSCFDMEYVKQIHLDGNNFTGPIPNALLNSSTLLVLNLRGNSLSGRIPALIGSLPNLRILSLGNNQLSGSFPKWMCRLSKIRILDLSDNSFFGSIPSCLSNIAFGTTNDDYVGGIDKAMNGFGYVDNNFFFVCGLDERDTFEFSDPVRNMGLSDETKSWQPSYSSMGSFIEVQIAFLTKRNLLSYKHNILNQMSGLDLSCNNLTGEIPRSLGNLSSIRALNLSHNHLTGSIPVSFSNLTKVESLDLSYNNLSGEIPSKLVNLNFLEVFSVAYNNLSGSIPDKGQFTTFENSSYEGNPFLSRSTSEENNSTNSVESKEKWYEIDRTFFFASFTATYFGFLLGFGALLYINPYWRRRWFNFIENFLLLCCR